MKALKAAENNATIKKGLPNGIKKVRAKESAHIVRFVKGPETAVLPTVSLLAAPAIITAPGEIILKGEIIEINVNRAPMSVKRNSAHSP
jgi:hypothetical protein